MIFKKFKFITEPENFMQAIMRFFSTIIVKSIYKLPITPNGVTIFRTFIVVFSLILFSFGDYRSLIFAVILFYVFEILDHVDGDLARYKNLKSNIGPLLEQFIDTWSARPSNIFGFCIALGYYNNTNSILCFILFGLTAFGRIMWLEYREYFGWIKENEHELHVYRGIYDKNSFKNTAKNIFKLLYIWNNSFILMGALFYYPIYVYLHIDPIILAFAIVALLNNLPWMFIVYKGFSNAIAQDKEIR